MPQYLSGDDPPKKKKAAPAPNIERAMMSITQRPDALPARRGSPPTSERIELWGGMHPRETDLEGFLDTLRVMTGVAPRTLELMDQERPSGTYWPRLNEMRIEGPMMPLEFYQGWGDKADVVQAVDQEPTRNTAAHEWAHVVTTRNPSVLRQFAALGDYGRGDTSETAQEAFADLFAERLGLRVPTAMSNPRDAYEFTENYRSPERERFLDSLIFAGMKRILPLDVRDTTSWRWPDSSAAKPRYP